MASNFKETFIIVVCREGMKMEIIFKNNFKAELVKNVKDKTFIARLYSPKDMFLCSLPCDEEHFSVVAEALMNGYFAGWKNCKAIIKDSVLEATNIEIGDL